MSALSPEADMLIVGINVRYVPKADVTAGTCCQFTGCASGNFQEPVPSENYIRA
jgi:hypothetical protein